MDRLVVGGPVPQEEQVFDMPFDLTLDPLRRSGCVRKRLDQRRNPECRQVATGYEIAPETEVQLRYDVSVRRRGTTAAGTLDGLTDILPPSRVKWC
jgi:hypothetical protein